MYLHAYNMQVNKQGKTGESFDVIPVCIIIRAKWFAHNYLGN